MEIYPLQVQDCSHLCETSKLVPDSPGGDSGEVCHERAKLFIKLKAAQLWCQTKENGTF